MRRLATTLLALGAALGGTVGLAILTGYHVPGMPWIVAVGLAKLTLVASGGIMTAGAVCLRLDRRESERRRLDKGHREDDGSN